MQRNITILAQKVFLAQKLVIRHSILENQINIVGAHLDPAVVEPLIMVTHLTTFTKPTPVRSAAHQLFYVSNEYGEFSDEER